MYSTDDMINSLCILLSTGCEVESIFGLSKDKGSSIVEEKTDICFFFFFFRFESTRALCLADQIQEQMQCTVCKCLVSENTFTTPRHYRRSWSGTFLSHVCSRLKPSSKSPLAIWWSSGPQLLRVCLMRRSLYCRSLLHLFVFSRAVWLRKLFLCGPGCGPEIDFWLSWGKKGWIWGLLERFAWVSVTSGKLTCTFFLLFAENVVILVLIIELYEETIDH